jgi:aspartate 1-decarboxylase
VNNLKVRNIDSARKEKPSVYLGDREKKIIGANGADAVLIAKIYADLCVVSNSRAVQRTAELLNVEPALVTTALRIARRNKWLTSSGAGKSGGELTSHGEVMFHSDNGVQREKYFLSKA